MSAPTDPRIPVFVISDPAALPAALDGDGPAALLVASRQGLSADGAGGAATAPAIPEGAVALGSFAATTPAHAAACACCAGRPPAALALDRLFQDRVRGRSAWFARVVALAPNDAARRAIETAVGRDPLTAARYRMAAAPPGVG